MDKPKARVTDVSKIILIAHVSEFENRNVEARDILRSYNEGLITNFEALAKMVSCNVPSNIAVFLVEGRMVEDTGLCSQYILFGVQMERVSMDPRPYEPKLIQTEVEEA